MQKIKVLFVDDEPNILEGLRRMLRPLRNDIDIHFADGGQQALDLMADTPFAVVVSDMRMPGMDGAELLGKIQEMHPSTIRVMLTGQADDKSIMRTVGIVHQFLAKPCNPDKLKSVLIQSGALQEILSDGSLKDLISQIGKLPSLPTTYAKLQQAITSTDPDINEVGKIIGRDIAMSAKVLQLVNSSFFGIYNKVDSPARAVKLLGLDTIKVLVLGLEIFAKMNIPKNIFQIETLWFHSLQVGKIAKAIAARESEEKEVISNAFIAGILHDIGKLVLLSYLPEKYLKAIRLAEEQKISLPMAEQAVFGSGQSAVGAYLIGLWGFVSPIVEAIAFHPTLERYPVQVFSPALAVHAANILYYQNRPGEIIGKAQQFNVGNLDIIGIDAKIAEWQEICVEVMAGVEED